LSGVTVSVFFSSLRLSSGEGFLEDFFCDTGSLGEGSIVGGFLGILGAGSLGDGGESSFGSESFLGLLGDFRRVITGLLGDAISSVLELVTSSGF